MYTQNDLLTIQSVISSGTKRFKLNGREVERQSIEQLLNLKQIIEMDLQSQAVANGTQCRARTSYRVSTSKGL